MALMDHVRGEGWTKLTQKQKIERLAHVLLDQSIELDFLREEFNSMVEKISLNDDDDFDEE